MSRVSISWPEGRLGFPDLLTPRLAVAVNVASPILRPSWCPGGELVYTFPTSSIGKSSSCIGLETSSGRLFGWFPLLWQQGAGEEVMACCHTFLRSFMTSINGIAKLTSKMTLGGMYEAARTAAILLLFDSILPVSAVIKNHKMTNCDILQHTIALTINEQGIRELGQTGADGAFFSLSHSAVLKPEVQNKDQQLVGNNLLSPNIKRYDDLSVELLKCMRLECPNIEQTMSCLFDINPNQATIHQYSSVDDGTSQKWCLPWNIDEAYKDYILAPYYAIQWKNSTGKLETNGDEVQNNPFEYKLVQKDIMALIPPGKRLPRGLRRTAPKDKRRDPHKPRGYISAFNFFSQDQRARAYNENKEEIEGAGPKPSERNNTINKILGKMWKELSPKKRAIYDEMATSDKRRYLEEMKSYEPSKGFVKDVPRINPLQDRMTAHRKRTKRCQNGGLTRPKPAYSFFAAHEKHALAQLPETGQALMSTIFGQRWLCMNEEEISCYYSIERVERSRYEARCPQE